MSPQDWPEASQGCDSDLVRRWIPVVVPLCAVVLSALAFLVGWESGYRP